jgi:hypothetical protein
MKLGRKTVLLELEENSADCVMEERFLAYVFVM